jgi:hypothetical protein
MRASAECGINGSLAAFAGKDVEEKYRERHVT